MGQNLHRRQRQTDNPLSGRRICARRCRDEDRSVSRFLVESRPYLDLYDSEGHAVGAMSKVFCGELLFGAVFKAMQVMGVNALDRRHPVERYLREALVFPLYDAGNVGMQMRKI